MAAPKLEYLKSKASRLLQSTNDPVVVERVVKFLEEGAYTVCVVLQVLAYIVAVVCVCVCL